MFNIFSRYTPQQVKDAQQLLNLYTKESVRKFVETQLDNNRMVLWKGRPLVFYGQLFSIVAKTQQGLGEKYKKYYKDAKKSPQEFKNFLRDYVTDERKFNFFKKAVIEWEKVPQKVPVNPILPENIERLPEGQEKTKRIEGSVYQADKEIEKEEQKQDEAVKNTEGKQPEVEGQIVKGTSQPQALGQLIKTTPVKIKTLSTAVFSSLKEKLSALILKAKQVKVPSFVKNLSVNAQIAAKKFISRFPSQIAGGTAGAVAGFFVAGPAGAGLGLIGGAVAGNFINNTLLQQTPNYSSAEISEILTPQGEVINSSYATPPDNEVGEKQQGALQRKLLTRTSTLFRTGPIIIGVFIIIFLLTAFLLLFDDGGGGMFDAGSGKKPPSTGTGIQSCTFTRAGSKAQLKSSTLSGWISEAASRHQIPTAILASIIYHENQSLFPETNDHDAFKNNYYYFVNPEGETRAIGLSQISVGRTPIKDKDGNIVIVDHCKSLLASDGSFTKAADSLGKKIMDQDYYCVDDVDERVRRFCQIDTAVTGKAFYTPPDNKSDNNYLNLCQLTDNLEVGAVHLVGKLGSGSWDKQDDVTKAISGYYGKCDYGGGNYCTEVWNDYQNCQISSPSGTGTGAGSPTQCSGTPVSFGAEKKFLPLPSESDVCKQTLTGTCGRPGTCVTNPTRVVLHTTGGSLDATGTFNYFANGSDNRGVGSHFIIGKDGTVLQAVETLDQKVEVAYAVAGYVDHISLEIVHPGVYSSKTELPEPQYQAVLSLVEALMKQYNIPLGNIEYTWKANQGSSDLPTVEASAGIYGHYQLNPLTRSDPGSGFLKELREDLKI